MLLSWLRNLPGRLLLAIRALKQHYRLRRSGYVSQRHKADGVCIHSYRRTPAAGSSTDRPMVFLHGLLDSARSFRYLARHLEDRPLLLVDLPGYGRSSLPAVRELWHLPVMARLLYRYLEGMATPFELVTHSMGGLLALQMLSFAKTLGRPLPVVRLHLIAPGLLPLRPEDREYRRKLFYPESAAVVADLLSHLYHSRLPEIPSSVLRALCSEWNQEGYHYLAWNTIEMEKDIFFTIQRIQRLTQRIPLHFYWGKEDRIIPWREGRTLARKVGGTFDLFPECGHAIHLEDADKLARTLRARAGRAVRPGLRSA
ncbi:MAG: alpha/beta fold hydrolase [Spirochaetales bacterium]|nr:alpha/beta fold hydrolase [Spirochaetales bacterium]